ncbi:sensor histidine kinase [Paenibacillus harenae]|uniref:sensor histidine kinase n=1 Tax=Paenibacillus harenae TaxID=306543 RepID=UPI00278CC2C9|nr:HAMP domain-containing sensor histidine kinase [Paenibacillus harenae]MDQ0057967.1 signal transduction histidine kinase [Paenibacillus harenae]
MLFYFAALLLAAIIVLLNNRNSETSRWTSFFLFFASIGGTSDWLIEQDALAAARLVQLLNYTITPYGVLIFSLLYADKLQTRRKRNYAKTFLLIPSMIIAILEYSLPNRSIFYIVLLLCSAPYYLASCYMLITSFWQETDARMKRNRFISMLIIVPPLLGVLIFIYVAKVIYPAFDFFQYISVFMIYSFALALLCTFLYGVLGVRLKFVQDPLQSTMQAVSSGTALLNHTIKNEIGKIAISTENLKSIYSDTDVANEQSQQHMQIIENATEHMLGMVSRIHNQMKPIVLQEQSYRLDKLMDQCIAHHVGLFQKYNVEVATSYVVKPVIVCDPIHLSEAISNILTNACDAMAAEEKGKLSIRLEAVKRAVVLTIQDSGHGIPQEHLARVFDPFYSSGKSGKNFGLGLSYVYNVMAKSGGNVKLSNGDKGGLTVSFYFPRHKVVRIQ